MTTLPTIFVSHGAPTLLIEQGPTHTFLQGLGDMFERPHGIVCISAHWETPSPRVTGTPRPQTIHDFYGFPRPLYELDYPATGDPVLASKVARLLQQSGSEADVDGSRGLDHGAWVPLMLAYPKAGVPVVQLSVQPRLGPRHHVKLGQALQPLRGEGVLILGSGGATHNLREFHAHAVDAAPADYAKAFDSWLEETITSGRQDELIDYERRAPAARRNHPTAEHFLPLFVPRGAAGADARGRKIHEAFTYGVLSMAAYAWD